jgi:hypothetical protein
MSSNILAFLALGCENKFQTYLKLIPHKCIQLRNSEIITFTAPILYSLIILVTEGKKKLKAGRGVYCSSLEWREGERVRMSPSPYLN